MQKKPGTTVRALFFTRICLWITALTATVYWIGFSFKLYADEIYETFEYATRMRPVLYTCLVISIAAIGISFVLHAISERIKKKENSAESYC